MSTLRDMTKHAHRCEEALLDLCNTIEATGGVIAYHDGTHGCAGDRDWIDLADSYLRACAALGREPMIDKK